MHFPQRAFQLGCGTAVLSCVSSGSPSSFLKGKRTRGKLKLPKPSQADRISLFATASACNTSNQLPLTLTNVPSYNQNPFKSTASINKYGTGWYRLVTSSSTPGHSLFCYTSLASLAVRIWETISTTEKAFSWWIQWFKFFFACSSWSNELDSATARLNDSLNCTEHCYATIYGRPDPKLVFRWWSLITVREAYSRSGTVDVELRRSLGRLLNLAGP